jgi:nitric oxide reductase subunit B
MNETKHNAVFKSNAPQLEVPVAATLSPWWRRAGLAILISGLTVLLMVTLKVYQEAPPIPKQVLAADGTLLFTDEDVRTGQQVFLKYGLMDNGSIWGHGAYLGPDYSAQYLHTQVLASSALIARQRYGLLPDQLTPAQRAAVEAEVRIGLKQNNYDPRNDVLTMEPFYGDWFRQQTDTWNEYFSAPKQNGGLSIGAIRDPEELRQLSAFVAWATWASVANRPGKPYSYTNNFPYDPLAGNTPTADAVLWSVISLIFLLGGTALVLLAFGKFNYLGWKAQGHVHPQWTSANVTMAQRATLKYFAIVALLFIAQALIGGGVAHYRADPNSFYGFDLASWLPSNLLRTWHLQLAIFWIATAFVAGALFLSAELGRHEPAGQTTGIHALFWLLVTVVVGSLLGEWAGIQQLLPQLWFWFGNQGWEYLELGRAWQLLLAVALLFWFGLLVRALLPALHDPERREIAGLFLFSAIAIPLFYLPAMFFDSTTHFSIVDTWRFWIIHLWVEGFFEFFVTVLVAVLFFRFGVVSRLAATRIIYLDAILYFAGGIIGTGHHMYWTGQTQLNMALSASFSALEVVPLTLLTLDAWDFITLTQSRCVICQQTIAVPHKWTFYFLIAVGVWNFVGAGIFGFLINLPIVSYYEAGTLLTPNHGHAALMGVFGNLGIGLLVFAVRQAVSDPLWQTLEKFVRTGFWGINIGLLLMVVLSLFPAGLLQLLDVLENGYWHARGLAYTGSVQSLFYEWLRLAGDLVFILFGAIPIMTATVYAYLAERKFNPATAAEADAER